MENNNNLISILLGIFLVTTLLLGGFVVYDKLLKKEEVVNCPKCEECEKCEISSTSSNLGEKITNLKRITITETNQTIKIGSKTYKIRKNDNGVLYVDDKNPLSNDEYNADYLYLTDKFAFFTNGAQSKECIGFALSEKGRITIKSDDYQVDNFRIANGYLHADGHVWCGVDPENPGPECLIHDVLIKFADNTLIVTPYK